MTARLKSSHYKKRELPPLFERAISMGVLEGDDQETQRTKRLITGALWIALLAPWPQIAQLMAAGAGLAALVISASFFSAALVLFIIWRRPATFPGIFHIVLVVNLAIAVAMTIMFGGFLASGVNFAWGVILVFGAIVVFPDWRGLAWLAVTTIVLVGSSLVAQEIQPLYVYPNPEMGGLVTFIIVLLFTAFVFWYYVNQRAELLRISDDLLENILPAAIADRLKVSDTMIADEYQNASILFADVVDFTPMSAGMRPNELVALLNEVFSEFDRLVESRGLEKIKTIGDAYMVAAGVPEPRADHAIAICDLALDMQRAFAGRQFDGRSISFRIGINSGSVVAGIIGTKKFSYDLWGDSVNTASRMESTGRSGRIQITEATCALVRDHFVCQPGGVVDVKGKGEMAVWFLERRSLDVVLPPSGQAG